MYQVINQYTQRRGVEVNEEKETGETRDLVLTTGKSGKEFIDHMKSFMDLPDNLINLTIIASKNSVVTVKAEFYATRKMQ